MEPTSENIAAYQALHSRIRIVSEGLKFWVDRHRNVGEANVAKLASLQMELSKYPPEWEKEYAGGKLD